ncbi:ABC-2 type transport system ATP-binding protein [Gracilibacillus alcaliphilus]|nr:ATP-binding cassette domain-containing protein [Gracilibacillus alcaliphilus]MBM7675741.1 ABC-2 type transport system ATP-binding protein [Gracilibacillus alcaliphilus]
MIKDKRSYALSELAIEAKGLVKEIAGNRIVDDVNLRIFKGTVYGFLGPNGAGKTTTVRMLSTLLPIDGGTVAVFGNDLASEPKEVRKRISLAGQYAALDEDLTGIENIIMIARLLGYSQSQAKKRAETLLRVFGMEEAAKRQVKNYSGGMRRRIDIAGSIVSIPDILFLDEPTTGLDPESRNQVWQMIRSLRDAGTTVFLTTQYLEEADYLADRIAIIKKGKVIAEGTSSELKASLKMGVLRIRFADWEERHKAIKILAPAVSENSNPLELLYEVSDYTTAMEEIRKLEKEKVGVHEFSYGQPSLDEVFLQLTSYSESSYQDQPKERAN